MSGDETKRVIGNLEDVIRATAGQVGEIAITQAVIQTKQDSTYITVGRIEEKVNKINSRVDSLESSRDKFKGMSKTIAIIGGVLGLGLGALKIFL